MYETRNAELGFALPRWLTDPDWVRKIAGAVFKGTQITVPTPTGSMTFDLSDPASLAALQAMIAGAKISRRPTELPPPAPVFQVPGGFGTMALVAVGVLALVLLTRRR